MISTSAKPKSFSKQYGSRAKSAIEVSKTTHQSGLPIVHMVTTRFKYPHGVIGEFVLERPSLIVRDCKNPNCSPSVMQSPSALMIIHRYPCRLLDHRSHAILSGVHHDALHDAEFWLGEQTRAEKVGIFGNWRSTCNQTTVGFEEDAHSRQSIRQLHTG